VEIIKARWIRPEDLWAYEEIGYSKFKVVERFKKTDVLATTVRAYHNRRYGGNLIDILTLTNPDAYLEPNLEYFNKPEHVNVAKVIQVADLMNFALRDFINIDNTKFEGFIEFFREIGSCRNRDCDKCGFCSKTFDKVGTFDPHEAEKRRKGFEDFIRAMITGDVFSESEGAA
jgi:collagenase-like PrtC family protease